MSDLCRICRDVVAHRAHPKLCCDCFDVSFGMTLDAINEERAARGVVPLELPAPPCRPDCERCAKALPTLGVWLYNNWRSFGGVCT